MKDFREMYLTWRTNTYCPRLKEELAVIEQDSAGIKERFYKNLEFGTGGMRGIIGAGPNRMNIYTIRKATQGLANYLHKQAAPDDKKVVIAYDSRYMSREFALESALVLAYNNIKTYVFDKITPTPLLSFAVRELQAAAGIVITASHNPKEYNGYKVYNRNGGQITDELAELITAEIYSIEDVFAIKTADRQEAEEQGLLVWIREEILEKYLDITQKLILNEDMVKKAASSLKIVYSPLHGTGLVPVTRLFKQCGFTGLHVVEKQALPDPSFPTVVCPNPEEDAACAMALQSAQQLDADLIMVSDPDADRIGVVVKNETGRYVQLSGNQTGALLIDYILQVREKQGKIPSNGVIVKTIVTSGMGVEIAKKYGVGHIDVLTGFKYIGEKIAEFEESKKHTFIFGYEESYGYLVSGHVRDKDAVQTALCIAEMALYHKQNGLSLYARLQQLFEEFGYYLEDLININLVGLEGQQKIAEIMEYLRQGPPPAVRELGVVTLRDYLKSEEVDIKSGKTSPLTLPTSNVIYYALDEGAWCCVRPSGTEPKLKIYLGVKGPTLQTAQARLQQLTQALDSEIQTFLNVEPSNT